MESLQHFILILGLLMSPIYCQYGLEELPESQVAPSNGNGISYGALSKTSVGALTNGYQSEVNGQDVSMDLILQNGNSNGGLHFNGFQNGGNDGAGITMAMLARNENGGGSQLAPDNFMAAEIMEGQSIEEIPGIAGTDYPILSAVPGTAFNCQSQQWSGYFADVETRCQVFHVCVPQFEKLSLLCPNGTIFNQKHFVCDWWYNVDCNSSPDSYSLNAMIGQMVQDQQQNGNGYASVAGQQAGNDNGYASAGHKVINVHEAPVYSMASIMEGVNGEPTKEMSTVSRHDVNTFRSGLNGYASNGQSSNGQFNDQRGNGFRSNVNGMPNAPAELLMRNGFVAPAPSLADSQASNGYDASIPAMNGLSFNGGRSGNGNGYGAPAPVTNGMMHDNGNGYGAAGLQSNGLRSNGNGYSSASAFRVNGNGYSAATPNGFMATATYGRRNVNGGYGPSPAPVINGYGTPAGLQYNGFKSNGYGAPAPMEVQVNGMTYGTPIMPAAEGLPSNGLRNANGLHSNGNGYATNGQEDLKSEVGTLSGTSY